jgi:PAS domain S-box-containing protein
VTIVDAAEDAIVGESPDGTIVSWNKAAQRLYGYSAEMVLGTPARLLVPSDREAEAAELMRRVRRGERVARLDTVRLGMDGRRIDVSLSLCSLRSASGAPAGAASIAHDISERKQRERHLQILHQATHVLAQARSVEETLPVVLRVVSEGTGWSVAATWMPCSRPGVPLQLRCAAFWHGSELDGSLYERASRHLRLGLGEGLPGRVWEAGRDLWVADVAADTHSQRADEARRDGLHSCYLLPVRSRDGVVAVLEFLSSDVRRPDPIVLEMLNGVAGQIGEYLERRGAKPRARVEGAAV